MTTVEEYRDRRNLLASIRAELRKRRASYMLAEMPDGRWYIYDSDLGRQAVQPHDGTLYELWEEVRDDTFQRPLVILEVSQ